ncbi:hypothetical protein [Polaribacter sp. WD7]|nr:hypothetical protein [Polaribacter sp. WD7]
MRKEHTTPLVASGNLSRNFKVKKQSFLERCVHWFRDFVENAE